jgi:hypothetical protein
MMKKLVNQAMKPKKDYKLTHTKLFNPTTGRFVWMKNHNASIYLAQPNTPWQMAIHAEAEDEEDSDDDSTTTMGGY